MNAQSNPVNAKGNRSTFNGASSANKDVGADTLKNEKIPYKSIQSLPFSDTETIAAAASHDGIVILYNGNDTSVMKQIRNGASDADNDGFDVKMMLIGPYDPEFGDGKTDTFIMYYKGIPVSKRGEADGHRTEDVVHKLVKGVHMNIIRVKKVGKSGLELNGSN
ncbi:MAG: hypothetical protein JJ909_02965 [Roseivirga sp.]|uniref:hypothetical protein n=1 Tax=Roseivirga sp. TaxID=1964215 RepID=UPI001B23031F|nr:hypothetical protein [Roseivirga sp.]MBO6495546.1 hypothetical protein [Roseivirga sp.]MBO6661670.1 hypothetical protein [Roseivirga sp.]MBO6759921.1 hypothetical protein [Roseivirga sp.]MBO6908345.1 hypothetical protein [Roseivirga sp.]